MFNRVKFSINKVLFKASNKESFTKNKKIYNNKNSLNQNFNRVSVRKLGNFKQPNETNNLFLIAAIVCGTLFTIKKYKP